MSGELLLKSDDTGQSRQHIEILYMYYGFMSGGVTSYTGNTVGYYAHNGVSSF